MEIWFNEVVDQQLKKKDVKRSFDNDYAPMIEETTTSTDLFERTWKTEKSPCPRRFRVFRRSDKRIVGEYNKDSGELVIIFFGLHDEYMELLQKLNKMK
jgi:hypothetical protein